MFFESKNYFFSKKKNVNFKKSVKKNIETRKEYDKLIIAEEK